MIRFGLVLMMAVTGMAAAEELLENPQFKEGFEEPWRLHLHRPEYGTKVAEPKVASDGDELPVLSVGVPHASAGHYIMVGQPVALTDGVTYAVRFEAKYDGEPGGHLGIVTNAESKPWTNNGISKKIPVDSGWQRIEGRFTAKSVDPENGPVLRFTLGDLKGRVSLRNCSLASIEAGPVPRALVKVTRLEAAVVKKEVTYDAKPMDINDLAGAFASSYPAAQKVHGGKIYVFAGSITKASKAMRPGTFALELNYGAVRLIVGGEEFGPKDFAALEENLKAVRKTLKEAEKEAKKKRGYKKPSSSEQKAMELERYPTVACEGKVASYRNRVVEISPTQLVQVELAL